MHMCEERCRMHIAERHMHMGGMHIRNMSRGDAWYHFFQMLLQTVEFGMHRNNANHQFGSMSTGHNYLLHKLQGTQHIVSVGIGDVSHTESSRWHVFVIISY